MIQKKHPEDQFLKLRKQAELYLREYGDRSAKSGRFVLHILVLPSFDPSTSFELYEQSHHTSGGKLFTHLLAQTIWRMDIDLRKFPSPVERLLLREILPTYETNQVRLEQALAESVISKFTSVQIPAMLEDPKRIGIDGTLYEVAFGSSMVNARYGWWQAPPAEWQELAEATHETIQIFEQVIQSSETG